MSGMAAPALLPAVTHHNDKNTAHLLRRLALFALPFLVCLLLIILSGLYTGELMPISLVVELQQRGVPIRYAPVWQWEDMYRYKLQSALVRRPELMIVASSRGLFFNPVVASRQPDAFYNASLSNSQTVQHAVFLHELARQDALPAVIVLGIDITRFRGSDINDRSVPPPLSLTTEVQDFQTNFTYWMRQMMLRPAKHLAYQQQISSLGLDEWIVGESALQRGFPSTGQLLRFNRSAPRPFELGTIGGEDTTEVSAEMLAALDEILALARDHGSVVVGMMLPYNSDLFRQMLASEGHAYLPKAQAAIEGLFSAYDMPLHDFTWAESVGGSDDEIWDHWHPGDLLSLRVFKALAEAHPDLFAPYTDTALLQQIIDHAPDPVNLFLTEDSRPVDPLRLIG